jgi:hypothetical protein
MLSATSRKRLIRLARKIGGSVKREAGGSYKSFAKLTENWAIKFATEKSTIVQNFVLQRRASRFGLGPYCFGLMEVQHWLYGTIYLYITQRVELASPKHCNDECWQDEIREKSPAARHLCRRLFKLVGFNFEDTALRNIGVVCGRLVCIDFDIVYFGVAPIQAPALDWCI